MPNIRRPRLNVTLEFESLPKLDRFLSSLATKAGWSEPSKDRLRLVGEETLSSLLQGDDGETNARDRRLSVTARVSGRTAELEFIASPSEENLEDELSHLRELTEVPDAREVSFRLLQSYASSVRHQKYQNIDIVTVHVEGQRSS